MKMETWERLARGVKKDLAKSHRFDLDTDNKIARLYRIANFTRGGVDFGPFPSAPYEGKEEILINGNEKKVIVKNLGFGYYKLKDTVLKNFYKLNIGPLQKEFPQTDEGGYRIEYKWE